MSSSRIAIVSGGNRGIGFEICRQLAQRDIHVVLTSRDAQLGKAACQSLQDLGLTVSFHELDVTSAAAIQTIAEFVGQQFGRLDILINNAGIMIDPPGSRLLDSKLETYRRTFETNVLAPIALTQALLPLMKQHNYGRIVNMSSGLGQLTDMSSGTPAYRISKTALNAVTRLIATETRGTDILCNSACPGWVKTNMGGSYAPLPVAQGADTPVWLATLPDGGPTAGFFRDRQPIPW